MKSVKILFTSTCLTGLLGVTLLSVSACGLLGSSGPTVKSGYDIAVELCQLYYGEHPELVNGQAPSEICNLAIAVQPFVDEVLATKQAAGMRSAAAMKH